MKLPPSDWITKVLTTMEKCPMALVTIVAIAAITAMAYVRK